MDIKHFKVCRLCMIQEKSVPFQPFFEHGLGKYSKWAKYSRWLGFEIEEVDGITILICARCRQTLEEYVKYRDVVHKSNDRFKGMLEFYKHPIQHVEILGEDPDGDTADLIEVDYGMDDDLKSEQIVEDSELLEEIIPPEPDQFLQKLKKSHDKDRKRAIDDDFSYFSESDPSTSKRSPAKPPVKIKIKSEEIIKPAETAKPTIISQVIMKQRTEQKNIKPELPSKNSRKEPIDDTYDPDLELYLLTKKPPPPMAKPTVAPPNAKKSRKETHKLYDCPECDQKFCNDYERQDHWQHAHSNRRIRKRNTKRPTPEGSTEVTEWGCSYCELYFDNKFDMLLHRKRIHEEEESSLRCPHCHKQFKKLHLLRSHIVTSHVRNIHQCSDCGQCFGRRCALEIHIKRKKGEKDFVCEICSNGFASKNQLNNHMLVHSDLRPFTCDVGNCGMQFKRKTSIEKHIKVVHLKMKHHVCEFCGHRFSVKSHLKGHMSRIHQIVNRPN